MSISQRISKIETAMSIGNELVDEESCKILGLEYGVATMKDAKAVYKEVVNSPQSHPKFRILERMRNE